MQWQDSIAITPETDIRIRQGSYALVDMFVRYNLSENLSVALNATNLTDRPLCKSLCFILPVTLPLYGNCFAVLADHASCW